MARPKKSAKFKEPVRIRERKLKNGNVSLYLDIYQHGVRKYENLNLYIVPGNDSITKDQNRHALMVANKVKAERILEIQNQGIQHWDKIKQSSMTLVQWLMTYEQSNGNFSQSTLKGRKEMRHKVEQFLEEIGRENITMKELDQEFCRRFMCFLRSAKHGVKKDPTATISQGAAHHHQAVLNGALNKAVREGIIPSNPLKMLDSKEKCSVPESMREFLTIDELKTLVNTPCKNGEVKRAFLLSCFTGLRLGDVRALTWEKILVGSDGTKYIRCKMEKTQHVVEVPLSAEALSYLRETESPSTPIFTLPQTPTVCHDIKKWIKAAGITKHITFHCARHTFATMMITLGADLYTTSKLLGHANITTTQIYSKIVDEKKVQAVNLVDGLFTQNQAAV